MSQVNKQEVFEYLSDLREAGLTNMFGAVPWLENQFGIDRIQGRDLLLEWIRSHNKEIA